MRTLAILMGLTSLGWQPALAAPAAPQVRMAYQTPGTLEARPLDCGQTIRLSATPGQAGRPALRSGAPLYGTLKLGTGAGFAFVLDESAGSGRGYDAAYVDTDRDGDLSDEKPAYARARGDEAVIAVALKVTVDGKERPLHGVLVPRGRGANVDCLWQTLGYYLGAVQVGGKSYAAALLDRNGSGTFNDAGDAEGFVDGKAGDMLLLGPPGSDPGRSLDAVRECVPWGRYALIDGRAFSPAAARDGSTLSLAPARLEMAPIKCYSPRFVVVLTGATGTFTIVGANGTAKAPVGSYLVSRWQAERTDKQGHVWRVAANAWNLTRAKAPRLTVRARGGGVFYASAPVARALPSVSPGGEVLFTLQLATARSENIESLTVDGERIPAPALKITDVTGRQVAALQFGYG